MNVKAIITNDRKMNVTFDFPENTGGTTNVYVRHLKVYSSKGTLLHTWNYGGTYKTNFVISETELLAAPSLLDTNETVDIHKDIFKVENELEYNPTYEQQMSCVYTPQYLNTAAYYACPIYDRIASKAGEIKCDMCGQELPYGLMYEFLKKKMVDSYIDAGRIEDAMKAFDQFYKNGVHCGCGGNTTSINVNCGCHGN